MITAIDTNILLDVLLPNPAFQKASSDSLFRALHDGQLVVCEIVLSELAAQMSDETQTEKFLTDTGVVLASTSRKACVLAGTIWKRYRKEGGARQRILPDFMVAAHALLQADQFLTRDLGFYRNYFKDLKIVSPG